MMNLDFGRTEILFLYLLPASINIFIFLFSYLKLEKTKTTLYFLGFVLLAGFWQLSDGLMKLSLSADTALQWNNIGLRFLLFFLPFGIYFIINLAGWSKLRGVRLVPPFLALATLSAFIVTEFDQVQYEILPSGHKYWISNPLSTPGGTCIFSLIGTEALLMLALSWLFYFSKRSNPLKKKQSLLLAAGLTLPVIAGLLFELIFPLYLHRNAIPVSVPLLTCFSASSLMAITCFKMFDYSPKHQWSKIVSAMNEGVLIVDNEDRIQYANAAFCAAVGYEFSELKNKLAHQVFLDEVQHKFIQQVMKDRLNKTDSQYELKLRTKNGDYVYMLVSGSPYTDLKGNVIGSIGVQTNITHLKKSEQQLLHVNARLAQSQQIAHFGSWEMDLDSGKTVWSDEACRIYGLPLLEKTEQTYDSWLSMVHPDDRDYVLSEIMSSRKTLSDSSFKHRIQLKDGQIKYIFTVIKYEFDETGKASALFGVCHDVTEQTEAETALERSESTMRTFINESLLAICFIEPSTKKISYANRAFCRLLGYRPNELDALTAYDFVNYPKENVDERIQELIQNKSVNFGERQWKKKNGQTLYVTVSTFYHKYNSNELIYVAAQDITERKLAEEKLKATNDELKTFTYKASHDIRGPLASVLGLTNIALAEVQEQHALRYFNLIDSTVKKLDYTLTQLVKAMRISDSGNSAEPIEFQPLVKEVLAKFEHSPGFADLKINTEIAVQKPFYSDRHIIETILQNLVENAIKYQRRQQDRSLLAIEIREQMPGVLIKLSDNGLGISQEFHEKVFNMYFRANADKDGSGLGLYLVKKGVDRLNGRLQLESEHKVGSVFTIHLPCMSQAAEQ